MSTLANDMKRPPDISILEEIMENTSIAIQQQNMLRLVDTHTATFTLKQLGDITLGSGGIMTMVDQLGSFVQKYGTYHLADFLYLFYWKNHRCPPPEHWFYPDDIKHNLLLKYFRPFQSKWIQSSQPNHKENDDSQRCLTFLQEAVVLLPEAKQHYYFRTHGFRMQLPFSAHKSIMIYGVMDDILLSESTGYLLKQPVLNKAKEEGVDVSDIIEGFYVSDLFLFPLTNVFESEGSTSEIGSTQLQSQTSSLSSQKQIIAKKIISALSKTTHSEDMESHLSLKIWIEKIKILETYVLTNKWETVVARFNEMTPFEKIQFFRFLLLSKNPEVQYYTHTLYDLLALSQTSDPSIQLFDILPILLKQRLDHATDPTASWNVPTGAALSLEQQVLLIRGPPVVKEKAMTKLKEFKSKSEEMTGKSRQYLEGLIRIPFYVFRHEPVLCRKTQVLDLFHTGWPDVEATDLSTIHRHLIKVEKTIREKRSDPAFWSKTPVRQLKNLFPNVPEHLMKKEMAEWVSTRFQEGSLEDYKGGDQELDQVIQVRQGIRSVQDGLTKIKETLDASVYGHQEAKQKIMQVMGQWMTNRSSGGYVFGFEGEPGIGKTSLANQGLSRCLTDEKGQPRPFHVIALGGSCNSSTLEGHNYTYSNSTWGRIVDILMESKCMNPIIYIDELDKVSKTENGKEIIGILTHIIDSSTNQGFQDKYFSGIDIDLSKVLFVFSYNRPEEIDKILLDRIHRIPFDPLSLQDKKVIVRKYIIPSLETKFGFEAGTVQIEDSMIEYLVESRTMEAGVRKIKQLLFDIYSKINLELLECTVETPIVLSEDLLRNHYLKSIPEMFPDLIHTRSEAGVMNALYATNSGHGGIIKIETRFFLSDRVLDMKLSGSLGKIFTESMEICRNLAWNMLSPEKQAEWLAVWGRTRNQGIHVHFGDCCTPKEGASASLASTLTIYSLLVNKPLRHDMAMTGETNLSGEAKRIGGVEAKFLGGIKAGVRIFFYPVENQQDVDQFMKKTEGRYKESHQFFAVSTLDEVINHPVGIFDE